MQGTPLPYYMCVDREGYVYAGAEARGTDAPRVGFLLKFDKGGELLSVFSFTVAARHVEQRIGRRTIMLVVTCVGDYLYVLLTEEVDVHIFVSKYVMDRSAVDPSGLKFLGRPVAPPSRDHPRY